MKIENSISVLVHLRKGDMSYHFQDNLEFSVSYQIKAMQFIQQKLQRGGISKNNIQFFVFSDDQKFAQASFLNLENVNIVSDGRLTDLEEFYLMVKCNHFIIPTSTFSWWAAYASD